MPLDSLFCHIDPKSFFKAFDMHVDPVVITDHEIQNGVKILYVNKAFCKLTGYSYDEIIGKSPKILQGPKSDRQTLKRLKANLLENKSFAGSTTNYRKDGSEYIVQWSVSPLQDMSGKTIAFIALQKILTKLQTENDEKLLLKAIVEHAPGMILVTDLEGFIVYANESFIRNTGYKEAELLGQHSRMLKSGKQSSGFYENMWQKLLTTGEYEGLFISKKRSGKLFYDKKKINVIKDEKGDPRFYLAVSYDVTKEIEIEKNLKTKAYQDSLTGAYNREKYNLDIENLVLQFHKQQKVFSIILLDIDRFKPINDTLGHDVGDFILKELASLVQDNIRSEDKLYRWGGEEFAVLVQKSLPTAMAIANKLKEVIKTHDFNYISITASFGVAQVSPGHDSHTLFKNADRALYQAKHSGRDRVVAAQ